MMTRRQLLQRAGALGAAGLAFPSIASAASRRAGAGEGGELVFDNWTAYIDPTEDGAIGTVDRFQEATGIAVTYNELINDNNEYFALIQPVLGRGDRIDADIFALTSWMAGRLISLGWVQELPFDQIPNAANLRDDLVNPAWDPEGKYSLPWQTGITGIAYNLAATGRELGSVADLFDPELRGTIGMLTEMRDTMGLLLLGQGVDPGALESFDDAAAAFEQLEEAKSTGQIRQFTGNDYLDDLATGNFAACIGWSGDVAQLSLENPDIRFIIPEEGGMSWADTMQIPDGAEHIDEAAAWMDFVYDPVEAAQITAWVQFISPVKGVQEEVAKIDAELAENELIFPTEETLSQLHTFANLSEDVEAEYDAAFSSIVGA
jgi:spermidine/putrescine transport system substrate-binding protein